MAENKVINQFTKGMVDDTEPSFQPEGTYRFALNATINASNELKGSISNIEGNDFCLYVPAKTAFNAYFDHSFNLVGTHLMYDNTTLLFIEYSYNTVQADDSTKVYYDVIGQQKPGCEYQELIFTQCLGLRTLYGPIDCESKLSQNCDVTIYFTNGVTSYKSINLNRLETYLNDSVSTVGQANYNGTGWNCSKFEHFPDMQIPIVDLKSVNNYGGQIPAGSYRFAVRLYDELNNSSEYVAITPSPINITDDNMSGNYYDIDGASSVQSTTDPGTYNKSITKKSITLTLNNLDTDYSYYQIAVVKYDYSLGVESTIDVLQKKPIVAGTSEFTYTGTEIVIENITAVTLVEKFLKPFVVQHQEQAEGRLLLANYSEKKRDWSKFQRVANKVVTNWTTDVIQPFNTIQSDKSGLYSFATRGYMRDEIYAFGLVFVFNDGTESPVFHIPGRAKDNAVRIEKSVLNEALVTNITAANMNLYDRWAISGSYAIWEGSPTGLVQANNRLSLLNTAYLPDSNLVEIVANGTPNSTSAVTGLKVCFKNASHIPNVQVGDFVERWRLFNTAAITNSTTPSSTGQLNLVNTNFGYMGYHENTNEKYPNTKDCNGEYIYDTDYWDLPLYSEEEGQGFVRHHRMPDNTISPHFYDTTGWDDPGGNKHPVFNTAQSDEIDEGRMCRIFPLGVLFANIAYPAEYENEIQGYYVVRGIRKEQDKTIMDKGFMYNSKNYSIPTDGWSFNNYDSDNYPLFSDGYGNDNFHENGGVAGGGAASDFRYFPVDNGLGGNLEVVSVRSNAKNCFFSPKQQVGIQTRFTGFRLNAPVTWRYVYDSIVKTSIPNDMFTLGVAKARYTDFRELDYSDNELNSSNSLNRLFFNRNVKNYLYLTAGDTSDKYTLADQGHNLLFIEPESQTQEIWTSNYRTDRRIDDGGGFESIHTEKSTNWYTALTDYKSDLYNLYTTEYQIASRFMQKLSTPLTPGNLATANKTFGGDTFINQFAFKKLSQRGGINYTMNLDQIMAPAQIRILISAWYECDDIHASLRYSTDNNNHNLKYTPKHYKSFDDIIHFLMRNNDENNSYNKSLEAPNIRGDRGNWYKETFTVNPDFAVTATPDVKFPLNINYRFCDECENTFPNTLVYSEKSFVEDNTDNYRKFRLLSQKTFLKEEGPITNLFKNKNDLIVHFGNTLAVQQLRTQQLTTDGTKVNVAQGEFLSQPYTKLVFTDYAYGGSVHKWATCLTEAGTFYVDYYSRKIFLLGEGMKEIQRVSSTPMLNLQLVDQFNSLYKIDYPFINNTVHKYGIGFISTYDIVNRKWILHKKDFKSLDTFVLLSQASSAYTGVWFDDINNTGFYQGVIVAGIVTEKTALDFNDSNHFENCSWTVSYDIKYNCWESYWSYQPSWMWNDSRTFYSTINDLNNLTLWKHNSGQFQSYYGKIYPHIIHYIQKDNPLTEKYYNNIEYISAAQRYDYNSKSWYDLNDVTFNDLIVYNRNQISLQHMLNVRKDEYDSYFTVTANYNPNATSNVNRKIDVTRTEDYWRINDIRDYRKYNNIGLMTKQWITPDTANTPYLDYANNFNFANTNYKGQGYIDSVLNLYSVYDVSYNISNQALYTAKSPFELGRFKDKWIGIRLGFYPAEYYNVSKQGIEDYDGSNCQDGYIRIHTNITTNNVNASNR